MRTIPVASFLLLADTASAFVTVKSFDFSTLRSASTTDSDLTSATGSTSTISRNQRSTALPFLNTPPVLQDFQDWAGNYGFDPLGLATNKELLLQYREAEIKHSRIALLAALGWPLSEALDAQLADQWQLPNLLVDGAKAPSILNGGMDAISPVWWGSCLGLSAAIDMYGTAKSRCGDSRYIPGRLGFDPLKLESDYTREAEIKHGRLAMVAVTGYAVQEYVTQQSVLEDVGTVLGLEL